MTSQASGPNAPLGETIHLGRTGRSMYTGILSSSSSKNMVQPPSAPCTYVQRAAFEFL